jgi:hypothetical protein
VHGLSAVRFVLCTAGGSLLILAVAVDLLWTTLGTHGGGPLTGHGMHVVWRGIVALHRRRPAHRLLSFAGSVMLALTVIVWMGLLWLGCLAIFSAKRDAVVRARDRTAVTAEERVYFTGATLFTLGNSEYEPNGPWWRAFTVVTAAIGLGTATLAITYLLQVLSSVVLKRTLGALVSDTGGSPAAIIGRAWTGENFDGLELFMSQLTTMLHTVTEQHLAYPVLHYFHSEQLRTAAAVRIPSLYELTLILAEGVARPVRPTPMTLEPVRDAIAGFAEVIEEEFVRAAATAPPPPPLAPIRDFGVPTVAEAEFAAAVRETDEVRRLLRGLVESDGWSWEDVNRR